jgi:hypothetical protein|tara:strand:- start:1169 stop:1375 length:207 start_codon:yes stop_codon:yes gene_type:complete
MADLSFFKRRIVEKAIHILAVYVVPYITAELRKFAVEIVTQWQQKAKATPNPKDDIIPDALAKMLGIT